MNFVVTIDTEADGQWEAGAKTEAVSITNLGFIPRFQELCDRYAFKPTYLCTYEVVVSKAFDEILLPYHASGRAEIGTHLHPWTNPPFKGGDSVVLFDRSEYPGYPSELPLDVFRAKMKTLTDAIATKTGRAPTSYRAGRWGFSAEHIAVLKELGYIVDCSVTPLVDRTMYKGVSEGGPDYRRAPVAPYELASDDVCSPGTSGLLEVPVTILYTHPLMRHSSVFRDLFRRYRRLRATSVLNRALRLEPSWFRPYPSMDARRMRAVHRVAREIDLPVIEMMFHSSELMPGGSESFLTPRSIEALYTMFERTFAYLAREGCRGVTLSDFAREHTKKRRERSSAAA